MRAPARPTDPRPLRRDRRDEARRPRLTRLPDGVQRNRSTASAAAEFAPPVVGLLEAEQLAGAPVAEQRFKLAERTGEADAGIVSPKQRRTTQRALAEAEPDKTIVERYYQHRAIRRIAETFEVDRQRRALVVMATGAGKTRTVIALADLLMRANWANRILFLADRTALVRQAVNAFKAHLPASAPVNLLTDKAAEGRVFVSTYPTMMGLIEEQDGPQRRFGVGHFDLIIVDEAHRSSYRKYGAIFDWFDSLLVGLTATPKDEIDRNTYSLFQLETVVPTDALSMSLTFAAVATSSLGRVRVGSI